jgi:hypothetical protein
MTMLPRKLGICVTKLLSCRPDSSWPDETQTTVATKAYHSLTGRQSFAQKIGIVAQTIVAQRPDGAER